MAQLKKAKLLERELESSVSQADNLVAQKQKFNHSGSISQAAEKTTKVDDENIDFTKDMATEVALKSRLTTQKELLGLKKKALALRREGRLDEVEEQLKKCKVLEHQLEEMNNVSKVKAIDKKEPYLKYNEPVKSRNQPAGEGEDDVTDQDMHDPTYLSVLRNLGWKDEDNQLASHPSKPSQQKDNLFGKIMGSLTTQASSNIPARASRRSKAEMQRELLGLKRKALSLRRQGKTDGAEEVLEMAKVLEDEIADMETTNRVQVEYNWPMDRVNECPLGSTVEKGDVKDVTEKDMLSALKNVGWKDEEPEPVTMQEKPSKEVSSHPLHSAGPSSLQTGASIARPRSNGEIQRQLLDLKRKALAHRCKGETEEAEVLLKMAKILEAQMEEIRSPKGASA